MMNLNEFIQGALSGLPFLVVAGPFLWRQVNKIEQKWEAELKEWKQEMREYKEELREARQRTDAANARSDQIMALLMANAGLKKSEHSSCE